MRARPIAANQNNTPSAYEVEAWRSIERWKRPATDPASKMSRAVRQTMQKITDTVRLIPGVDWTIENIVAGLVDLTNEIAHDWVWTEGVYRDFRRGGHEVHSAADILRLDLEHVDATMNGLRGKYQALAAAEGAATGYAGAAGIAPDVVGLVALNLRSAGEYAAHCGFDIGVFEERAYALTVLERVSSTGDVPRDVTIPTAVRATRVVVGRQAGESIESIALKRAVKAIARRLGINLTQRKLAQVVPVSGAVIGSAFNAFYTGRVCEAAYYLYRERFLVAKYGRPTLNSL